MHEHDPAGNFLRFHRAVGFRCLRHRHDAADLRPDLSVSDNADNLAQIIQRRVGAADEFQFLQDESAGLNGQFPGSTLPTTTIRPPARKARTLEGNVGVPAISSTQSTPTPSVMSRTSL